MLPDTEDPITDALREALASVLLGRTNVQLDTYQMDQTNPQGAPLMMTSTITMHSAFESRIRQLAAEGKFDPLIRQAFEMISAERVADMLEKKFAELIVRGLEQKERGWTSEKGWLDGAARQIAVEASTIAIRDDDDLLDKIRTRIGAEVDRNRVALTVNLSDPETTA